MMPASFGVNLANVNKQSFAQVNAITATVTALNASNVVTNSLTTGTASAISLTASNVWSPLIAGNTATLSSLYVSGTTYSSNLQILGTFTTINSTITSSSNLVINDYGTGPALTVIQQEITSQPVATFQAGAVQALYITNTGQIGLGKTTPGYTLDVSGSVNVSTLKAGSLSISSNVFCSNISATSINASTATISSLLTTTHINTTGHSSSNFSGTNENLSAFLNCSNIVANYVATGALSAATVLINGVAPLTSAPVTAWSNIVATNTLALSNVTASNVSVRGYSSIAPFQVYNFSSNQPTLQVDKAGQVDICGNVVVTGSITTSGTLNASGTLAVLTNGVAIGTVVAGIVSYSTTVGGGTFSQIGYMTAGTWIVTGYNLGLQCPQAGTVQWVSFATSIGVLNSSVATPQSSCGGVTSVNGAFTLYATTCVVLSPTTGATYYWMCVCNNQTNVTGFTWNVSAGQLSAIKIA